MMKISELSVQVGQFQLLNIGIDLMPGEYFVILGASGSGKTVFLETIAGRYCLKKGSIVVDDQEISSLQPERRNIGFVYQNYELFPHMTVQENISFALKLKKVSKKIRNQKAHEMMEILSLSHIKDCYPSTLSGGEKQRTAIGRALVILPKILLLDEPMSALDYVTKNHVKNTIKRVHQQFVPTVLHVTHDIEEALFFADRIGIIKNNTMIRVFSAEEIKKMEKSDFYTYL